MMSEAELASLPAPAPPPDLGRLLTDSTLYLASNIAMKLIGFVMIPFYAHFLSIDQYGVLQLLELATTVIAIAFGLQSVGAALTRIYHDQSDPQAQHRVVSTALIAMVGLAGLVCGLAMLEAAPIARAVSLGEQASLVRMGFAAMFFSSITEVVLVYQRMRARTRFFIIYSLITLVLTLGLNIVLIGFLHQGVWGFVYSKLVVVGGGTLFLLWRVLREVGVRWSPEIARALARFAGPLVVSGASYFAIHFSDRLFLAHVSRAEVGVYAQAYTFAFLLSVLIGDAFNKTWNVSFYSFASGEGWQARFVQVGRWLIFVLGSGALGIALFGRDALVLMVPPSYYPPVMLLPVLVFGYFLREVGDFFNSMLLIGAGSGLVGRIAVAGALFNLALNAWLIPRYGIWGAAWATFITWSGYCAVSWGFAWRRQRVGLPPWPLAVMLLASALCLALRHGLAPRGAVLTLALDCGCMALFLVAMAVLYLRGDERQAAWRAARRALPR